MDKYGNSFSVDITNRLRETNTDREKLFDGRLGD
jgi:hypothetical protein